MKGPEANKADRQAAAQATVSRQYLVQGLPAEDPKVTNEQLDVHRYVTTPATVQVGMGLTLNLGNFESARIDVHLSTPCYREEIEDAYAYTKKWVEDRLAAEVADIRANKPALF